MRKTTTQRLAAEALEDLYASLGVLARAISRPTNTTTTLSTGPDTAAYAQAILTLVVAAGLLTEQITPSPTGAGVRPGPD